MVYNILHITWTQYIIYEAAYCSRCQPDGRQQAHYDTDHPMITGWWWLANEAASALPHTTGTGRPSPGDRDWLRVDDHDGPGYRIKQPVWLLVPSERGREREWDSEWESLRERKTRRNSERERERLEETRRERDRASANRPPNYS